MGDHALTALCDRQSFIGSGKARQNRESGPGSRMDELIFQEFKGTGNMELILDRKLSDRRLFPAIDIPKSGTRKEEKLFPAKNLEAIRKLRRTMVDLNPIEAMETLLAALKKNKTNDELLAKLDKNS